MTQVGNLYLFWYMRGAAVIGGGLNVWSNWDNN